MHRRLHLLLMIRMNEQLVSPYSKKWHITDKQLYKNNKLHLLYAPLELVADVHF